ncbi:hypothetical protein ACFYYR_16975 [Streptomyces sp. NPDC001922]|uniref:hypothetical protein n=1 Tax=Streptomyces sp. NPDC001922 TaxID=3364624 RepID=UPI00367F1E6D
MSGTLVPHLASQVPEPALRPCAQRTPNLNVVRNSRIYWDDGALAFRQPDGSVTRYPTGKGGIARAVHVNLFGAEAMKRMPPAGQWGVLEFQNDEGRRILRVPLVEWLPEAPSPGSRPNEGAALLELTGMTALLKKARIPLETVTRLDDPLLSNSTRGPGTDPYFGRLLPVWHSVLRGTTVFSWLAFLLCAVAWKDSAPWLNVVAATAFVISPISDVALRLAARRGEREGLPAAETVLTPSPAPGAGATRRFCATAAIRVQPSDIVLVDSLGRERWLPRKGPQAPKRLVRIRAVHGGPPVGVEMRTRDGRLRAALPWPSWFGGPDGEARWTELGTAADLVVEDRVVEATEGADGWPSVRSLARADVDSLGPLDGKTARSESDFVRAVLGDASSLPLSLFGLLTVLSGLLSVDTHPVSGALTMVLATAGLCCYSGPGLAHQWNSRLRLDRPAPGQEATS